MWTGRIGAGREGPHVEGMVETIGLVVGYSASFIDASTGKVASTVMADGVGEGVLDCGSAGVETGEEGLTGSLAGGFVGGGVLADCVLVSACYAHDCG